MTETGGKNARGTPPPSCPLCGGPGRPFRSFGDCSLPRCSFCGSLFYVPPPQERASDADRPWESAKWYVERGANLLFYAEIASLVQSLLGNPGRGRPGRRHRVLEAGGSYGFLIDIGRLLYGWEIAAADPGGCAVQGSSDLGIPLCPRGVEDAVFDAPFDAVIGVQLIEHLHEPLPFAEALAGLVDEEGILFLTTPDASFEDLGPDYHPGEHVILFSREGIENVLARAGFRHCRRYSLSLPQMLAVAAARDRLPGGGQVEDPPATALAAQVETYMKRRLGETGLPDRLRAGLQFRLFELLVNAGRYGEAEDIQERLEALMGMDAGQGPRLFFEDLASRMRTAADHGSYEASGPGFTAPYLLYRGILELNHRGRREDGLIFLTLAEGLFDHEIGRLGLSQYEPFLSAARSARKAAGGSPR